MTTRHDTLIGLLGTVSTVSLSQWNDLVGLIAGCLTIAHLVRAHLKLKNEGKKK